LAGDLLTIAAGYGGKSGRMLKIAVRFVGDPVPHLRHRVSLEWKLTTSLLVQAHPRREQVAEFD